MTYDLLPDWTHHDDYQFVSFDAMRGRTIKSIDQQSEQLIFFMEDGDRFVCRHDQNCCESVYIESIVGDLEDLIGEPLLVAEEVCSSEHPAGVSIEYEPESFTWTFYKLATRRGYVDIRWFGSSNGYYGEGVTTYRYPKQ